MAVEDFTTWTEVGDAGNWITITSTSVSWDDLPRDRSAYVYTERAETGDFEHKFKFTTGASGQVAVSSWVYPYVMRSNLTTPDDAAGDALGLYFVNSSGTLVLVLRLRENGADAAYDISSALSYSTTYYITIARDDNGGANSTGQSVCYICTGNYNGQSGSSLVDTLTVDSAVGEQNDYSYVQTSAARASGGTYAQDGAVEDMDFGTAYVDAAGSISMSLSISAAAEIVMFIDATAVINMSLSISATASIYGMPKDGGGLQTKRRLIAIGNDCLYYEDS